MWQLSNLNNERNIVVKEFLDRFKKSEEIFEYLNQILYNFKNCKIQLEPQFLYLIGKNNQNLSFEICKLIISNPTEPLSEYLYTLLSCIREKDLTKALELMDCALKTKNKNIYLSLANGFWNSWSRDIANDEIYILKNLINYSDITVKKTAIESLKVFPNDKIKIAIEIALEFDFGCDESLANTLFGIFDSKYGIKFEVLNNNDLVNLLFKLINIKKVDSCLYNIDKFLGYCSFKFPEEVVDILLKRINLAEKLSNESHFDYEPLPYENFKYALKGIFTCPMYKDILIKVRDNAINTFNLNHLFGWTSNLFIWLSNNFSQESIEVLNEWIDSENSYKIKAIGFLLSKAPPMFVFSNSKFVSKLLEKSYEINIECYEHIFNILFSSAISGSYIGIAGEPYPRNIEILNKSKELLENFPKGTPIYQFYKKLSEYASKAIQEDKLEYEELSED